MVTWYITVSELLFRCCGDVKKLHTFRCAFLSTLGIIYMTKKF
jgi:hypothetical protein